MQLGLTIADYVVLIFAVGLMLFVSLKSRAGSISMSLNAKPMPVRYAAYFLVFIAVLVFGAYGVGYDASQFIYSQF